LAERSQGSIRERCLPPLSRPNGGWRKLWCIADEPFLRHREPRAVAARRQTCRACTARLREKGLHVDVIASTAGPRRAAGSRSLLSRVSPFLAVGGDGTAHEILNGVFVGKPNAAPLRWDSSLGTGNSFLRDFTK